MLVPEKSAAQDRKWSFPAQAPLVASPANMPFEIHFMLLGQRGDALACAYAANTAAMSLDPALLQIPLSGLRAAV